MTATGNPFSTSLFVQLMVTEVAVFSILYPHEEAESPESRGVAAMRAFTPLSAPLVMAFERSILLRAFRNFIVLSKDPELLIDRDMGFSAIEWANPSPREEGRRVS